MLLAAAVVVFAFAVVLFLARGRRAEGIATAVDAPWSDFCEARGLWIEPATGLLGETWPTISGDVDGVHVAIDVRDDGYAGRAPATRVAARALAETRGVLRVESRRGRNVTASEAIATGDAAFDDELRAFGDAATVARLLDEAVRRALLDVARRHAIVLEVDSGRVTLTIAGVLAKASDLDVAVRAVVACARARGAIGYR